MVPAGYRSGVDLDAFVTEHDAEWRRLDVLAGRFRPTAAEVDELVMLYQRAATHLSMVRSRSPDPALVARLSRLVLRARATLTGGRAGGLRLVGRFFTETFPLAVYRCGAWWGGVAVSFVALSAALIGYFASHPAALNGLVGSSADVKELAQHGFQSYYSDAPAQDFAFQVWTNNALVAALCLASGILLVPVLYMLASNALNVGVDGGAMFAYGRADLFFGLILPHGLLELTAVFIAAGTGLRIGWSWVAPGPHRGRGQALAASARSGVVIALGLACVLLVSGVIEAFVTPSGLPTMVRIAIGLSAFVGFLAYIVLLGSRAAALNASPDLDPELREAEVPTA